MGNKLEHIGIIMDGTEEWAELNNINIKEAYKYGFERMIRVIYWWAELDIYEISFHIFPNADKDLLRYVIEAQSEQLLTFFKKHKIRVNIFGCDYLKRLERATEHYKKKQVNLCFKLNNLSIKNRVDLMIKTDKNTLSEFLLLQSVGAKMIFLEGLCWPMLQKKDFIACLKR